MKRDKTNAVLSIIIVGGWAVTSTGFIAEHGSSFLPVWGLALLNLLLFIGISVELWRAR